ncbi:sugar ABC transporter permease [bacterium]|uniref:multiple monosaccharide ABC transporter permease n=1 Tax=Lachnospiraceae TaxID=186803 RepID=UPI002A7E98DF|nr:sugar ABC transporter permease [bacterium]MCI7148704.1 sugar ABC transporter permease [bacterium]MDY2886155.1 multiple monosaccharide ABC transporter permease [Bariatricus sp.]MDY4192926.1 multiple monosaccharide ABC transporter permease [Bariatricus sp.]MDY4503755.1 multiple monosaccharide ABC transporter permease [Bariatricus sp.]
MEKKKTVNLDLKQFGMVFALIAIYIIFYFMTGGINATPMNMNNLIMQNSYVVILATGMLLCVLTGNVDLGVGSYVALCGAIAAKLVVENGMSIPLAFLITILVGTAFGAFNGFFIAYLDIPPFVVTLAGMLIGRGLTYTLLESKTVGPLPDAYVKVGAGFFITNKIQMGSGTLDIVCIIVAIVATALIILSELKSIKTRQKYGLAIVTPWQTIVKLAIIIAIVWFFFYKLARYNGIPIVLIIMAVIVGIYHFITSKTVPGRQIYALGGNAKAARLSGIDTRKVFFWVYTNMGFLAAIAGIVLSARNASATPKAGDGFELDAIASCYIGGAAAAGGIGTVIGAVVGAFVMGVLNNGMFLIGLSTDLQKVVKGLVLLGAVTFDILSNKKKK